MLQLHSHFLCGPDFTPKLFSFGGLKFSLVAAGCCRNNYADLITSVIKHVLSFSEPKFIKAVQHKWYFIAECSFYGEHFPFWAGERVCFKVNFSIYKPPTYFSSGSHQGHPCIIRQEWAQHRKSSDNLWEVG